MSQTLFFFLAIMINRNKSLVYQADWRMTMSISVITSKCPQNHICPSVKICPVGALIQNGFSAPVVDDAKCIKCNKCVKYCPMGALRNV